MSRKWNYNMDEAPKDGTVIEVMETPNGESFNILPARWHTLYHTIGGNPPADGIMTTWWGLGFRTGCSEWNQEYPGRFFGRSTDISCSPFAWRDRPKVSKKAIKKYNEIQAAQVAKEEAEANG